MLSAFGLYTHIQANRRRSGFLIAGLFVLFYLLAFALAILRRAWLDDGTGSFEAILQAAARDSLWLAPAATALAALWVWCGFRLNTLILNLTTGSTAVTRAEAPRPYALLQNLCISRGMTMPKLRILETTAPNAYASGTRPDQYTITLTRGLLDTLDDRELEAVLAHELTHIRNGDVRTMMVAVLVVGIISFLGEMIYRWLANSPGLWRASTSRRSSGKGGGGARLAAVLVAVLFIVVAWQLSVVIRFALSRRREYLADAGAVELTKNPDAMISALRKIEGKGEIEGVPSAVMELCLDNPRSGFSDLFATHPTVEDRIDALVRFAGGHPVIAPVLAEPEAPAA
ncbi:M48 family metallopeptidase [Microvirga lenta]|uniref:M48 family metallopeptidase n=1 Tax=Microvirga lenta TaxID=2881337 RepID=UPI001CFFB6D0|nr:M48 family metallopeptidase [Microvirga lenta]MCB5176959.1 M48 family metallopeptidase [Microvirga lenta]